MSPKRRIGFDRGFSSEPLPTDFEDVPKVRMMGWTAGLSDILAVFMSRYTDPISTEEMLEWLREGQAHHEQIAQRHDTGSDEQQFHTGYAFAYGRIATQLDPQADAISGP